MMLSAIGIGSVRLIWSRINQLSFSIDILSSGPWFRLFVWRLFIHRRSLIRFQNNFAAPTLGLHCARVSRLYGRGFPILELTCYKLSIRIILRLPFAKYIVFTRLIKVKALWPVNLGHTVQRCRITLLIACNIFAGALFLLLQFILLYDVRAVSKHWRPRRWSRMG